MKRINIKILTELLQLLPKDMKVNVFSPYKNKYFSNIFVWEEGHDHRHFIELMEDKWDKNNKWSTVSNILIDLKKCYTKHNKEYRDSIYVNIDAPIKYRSTTSIIQISIKNGELFLKGKKPSWMY